MMIWLGCMALGVLSALGTLALRARRELREGLLGHEHARGADEVGHADAGRRQHRHARQVAERQRDGRLLLGEHDQDGAVAGPVGEQPGGLLRRGLGEARRVEDRQRVALGVYGQRAAQRGAALLAADLERVVARGLAEEEAATGGARPAERPLARAAGALLPPRLPAAAADVAARLRRRGAPTARV